MGYREFHDLLENAKNLIKVHVSEAANTATNCKLYPCRQDENKYVTFIHLIISLIKKLNHE